MKKKKKNVFLICNIIFTMLMLITLGILSYSLFQINVIPTKYLLLGYVFILIVLGILLSMMYLIKNSIVKIFAYILIVVFGIGALFATNYLNNTYHFFQSTQTKQYDTLTYSVLVLEDSKYDEITNLKNKTISYLEDAYKNEVQKQLKEKVSYKESLVTEFGTLPDKLLDKTVDAICLEESYLKLVEEEVDDFSTKAKVIYTFEVQVKVHQEEKVEPDVSKEPFLLYISGIDQYGNVNSVRGRSDVNQIAVVNPKTNHILLVNTPRDYYVQLAGTTGLKDKLTHAGIYGIEKSIATLENLYNVDIQYYLRVNFDTLIKVVDVIDGIDIESDASFIPWTNRNVRVNEGWNHMDGATALAYARERKTYLTGDHHRGANQQQVITAIINKVTQSHVLISKYNSILNALEGTFQTDMSMDMITSFLKYQLEKMPSWNVESIAVTGTGSMDYTYSMGAGRKLYVMNPDYSSVSNAQNRIKEVLNEN